MVQARNTKLQHRCTALTQAGKSLRLCARGGVISQTPPHLNFYERKV